jgi:hypothetical protein
MIPTAEEFLKQVSPNDEFGLRIDLGNNKKHIYEIMRRFARLHVREARKQFKIVFSEIDDVYPFMRDDKLSDVYPLTNIV